jgi:hypothetical protein
MDHFLTSLKITTFSIYFTMLSPSNIKVDQKINAGLRHGVEFATKYPSIFVYLLGLI